MLPRGQRRTGSVASPSGLPARPRGAARSGADAGARGTVAAAARIAVQGAGVPAAGDDRGADSGRTVTFDVRASGIAFGPVGAYGTRYWNGRCPAGLRLVRDAGPGDGFGGDAMTMIDTAMGALRGVAGNLWAEGLTNAAGGSDSIIAGSPDRRIAGSPDRRIA